MTNFDIVAKCTYTLNVDEKCDMYNFGVVLMELLMRRKPIDLEFGEVVNIMEWVREKIRYGYNAFTWLMRSIGGE